MDTNFDKTITCFIPFLRLSEDESFERLAFSLAAQTYEDVEPLVFLGDSPGMRERALEILNAQPFSTPASSRIRFFSASHYGLPEWHAALSKVRGRFFMILEENSALYPYALEVLSKELEKSPKMSTAGGARVSKTKKGESRLERHNLAKISLAKPADALSDLFDRRFVSTSSLLFDLRKAERGFMEWEAVNGISDEYQLILRMAASDHLGLKHLSMPLSETYRFGITDGLEAERLPEEVHLPFQVLWPAERVAQIVRQRDRLEKSSLKNTYPFFHRAMERLKKHPLAFSIIRRFGGETLRWYRWLIKTYEKIS